MPNASKACKLYQYDLFIVKADPGDNSALLKTHAPDALPSKALGSGPVNVQEDVWRMSVTCSLQEFIQK